MSSVIDAWTDYALVVAIGALTGLVELVTRYKDNPTALFRVSGFWWYLVINGIASAAVLRVADAFEWTSSITAPAQQQIVLVVLAGFGAMAILRAKFLTLRVQGTDVEVGPGLVVDGLLKVVDRQIDRNRARSRSNLAAEIMADVDFSRASLALPVYCLQLLQNLPSDEAETLRQKVRTLAETEMDDGLRSLNLGLLLMNTVGPEVLTTAVYDLRSRIAKPEPDA